ncbi:MAG: hypothetical protein Q7U74_14860 [Saprospiraceae bacterium]|nr:hypothetical protein [Saprospiraceae bacterium]
MDTSIPGEKPGQSTSITHLSFLNILIASLLTLMALLALAEIGARILQTRTEQPIRSIGNFHTQFETKWFKLQDYVKVNDGVDVMLMGNSMVNTGIDAELLAETYEAATGVNLRIYNFGVEGMDLYTNSELASLLVVEFHPKTVIFFTEMREYGPQTDTSVPERYETAKWFQYKLGNPSLEAWIYDHSAFMQYFLPYRNWSRADFPDTMLKDFYRYNQTNPAGYEPDRAYSRDLDVLTDPTDPENKVWFELYANYVPDKQNLNDLISILEQNRNGVQVLVTEMPVYKTFYDYFGGEPVHQAFITTIQNLSLDQSAYFLPPIDSELIPLVGRVDNHHLNFEGAPVYSRLLGAQLAELCIQDDVCLANEAAK